MRTFRSHLGLLVIGVTLGLAILHALSAWGITPPRAQHWGHHWTHHTTTCVDELVLWHPTPQPQCQAIVPHSSGDIRYEMCLWYDGESDCLPQRVVPPPRFIH